MYVQNVVEVQNNSEYSSSSCQNLHVFFPYNCYCVDIVVLKGSSFSTSTYSATNITQYGSTVYIGMAMGCSAL